ncbi:hypothetical protein [Zooshikella sp. RANM57]|uniref:hypothetical protein n=1 Tax=Zooshikella sp. RANM57 TaxID=3425863 RepID=UPI003D6E1424
MSIENQLAETVLACNRLTTAVNNKITDIDQQMAQCITKINDQLNQTLYLLPRIVITHNQQLEINEEHPQKHPFNFQIHEDVEAAVHMRIQANPKDRTADQMALLQDMGLDIGVDMHIHDHYRMPFNVIKLSWTKREPISYWLAFPNTADSAASAIPLNTFITIGAFVKVLAGRASGVWCEGARLGKWTFCRTQFSPAGFGRYTHIHPYRDSDSGEVLIALPAAITGHIDNPGQWYPNIELQKAHSVTSTTNATTTDA